MDYSVPTTSTTYTFEQACAVILKSAFCDPLIASTFGEYRSVPAPPGLDVATAYRLFRQHNQSVARTDVHPLKRIEAISQSSDVEVSAAGIKYRDSLAKDDVQLQYLCGSVVSPGVQGQKEAVRATTAEVISYIYTSTKPIKEQVAVSNFMAAPANGIPSVGKCAKVLPTWSANGQANANALYISSATTQSLCNQLAQTREFIEDLAAQKYNPAADNPLMISADGRTQPQAYLRWRGYVPRRATVKEDSQAYKVLTTHRAVRGEDGKGPSPLTVGYYMGAMTRSMYTTWWYAVDILGVMHQLHTNIVVLSPGMSMSVAQTIAANLGIVVRLTTTPSEYMAKDKVHKVIKDAIAKNVGCVISVYAMSVPHIKGALHVIEGFKASSLYKQGRVEPHSMFDASLSAIMNYKADHVMSWWGLSSVVFQKMHQHKLRQLPSVHVHSGAVIVLKTVADLKSMNEYDVAYHSTRMVTANIFKTHYPLSRMRFLEVDAKMFKYDNPYVYRITIRLYTPRVARVEDVGFIEISDEVLRPIDEVGDVAFESSVSVAPDFRIKITVPVHPLPALVDSATVLEEAFEAGGGGDQDVPIEIPPAQTAPAEAVDGFVETDWGGGSY